jgi:hypothetical protein
MQGFSAPKGYSPVVMPKYNPQQQDFLKNLLNQLQGGSSSAVQHLSQMAAGSPAAFEGQEAQAMKFFNNKLAPSISQQYAHQGMLGSSAFQGSLANAGQELSENMYNQRQDLQQQSIRDLLGLSTSLATNPTNEYGVVAKPKKEKFSFGSLLSLIGKFF